MEIGQKEIKEKKATLVRRDSGEKYPLSLNSLKKKIREILDSIQNNLFLRSQKFLKENTREVLDFKEFRDIMKTKRGFLKAFWCEDRKCEKKIKEETKATTRCLPLNWPEDYNPPTTLPFKNERAPEGKCIYCGKLAKRRWIFAQAY